tara:strand:- start:324 stop:902 length:579 start_codon:yes stop_codon:yes gene_type:complete
MTGVEGLVRDYGYWIILVGTYFDHYGIPFFLVFGGIAASRNILDVWIVLFCGFSGGWTADLFLYFLGYKTGLHYWMQFSLVRKFSSSIEFFEQMFHTRPAIIIMLGRFIFAFSKFIPPFAGMVRYNVRNYVLFSFTGNIIFSIVYTSASYFAGSWVLDSQTELKVVNVVFTLVFLAVMVLLTRKFSKSYTRN